MRALVMKIISLKYTVLYPFPFKIAGPAAIVKDKMNGLRPPLTSTSVPARAADKRAKALAAFALT